MNDNFDKLKERTDTKAVPPDESGERDVEKDESKHDSQGKLQQHYNAQLRERGTRNGDQASKLPDPYAGE
jgi:hypothetical protein